ncbi:hypothetical protein BsWGS_10834 [Bradybaena similaris]
MLSTFPLSDSLFFCAYLVHVALFTGVDAESNIITDSFKCSQLCVSQTTVSIPFSYEAVSRTQCAAECSKRSWCNSYVFERVTASSAANLQLPPKPCRLYIDTGPQCSAMTTAISVTGLCVRYKPATLSVPFQTCGLSFERVLEVDNSKAYIPQGKDYLSNILTSGNSLNVQFTKGSTKYTAKANYYTLITGIFGVVCASVLDSMSGFDGLTTTAHSRYFCANGSQAVDPVTSGLAEQFYWDVENLHAGAKQGKQTVFTKGDQLSSLLSAITNGFDITVLFITNNKVVHADVVTHNVKTHETTSQTRLYDNNQESVISHTTDGATMTTVWTPLMPALSNQISETSQSVWLADACWKFICSTSSSSITPITSLKESFESGRIIRVKITSDDLEILATPDYVEWDSFGVITAGVFRVLVKESQTSSGGLVGGLVNGVSSLLGVQSQTQSQSSWAHYVVSSNGTLSVFTTQIGLSECKYTSRTATVEWFEQSQNWSQIHSSSFGNVSTLLLLAAKVKSGSYVRVKIEVAGTASVFSCDMLEVVNNGQDVKCHVSGKASVSMSDSSQNSLLGGLTSVLSSKSSATCSIRSECFAISASTGATGPTTSCLWQSPVSPYSDTRSKVVTWFVL